MRASDPFLQCKIHYFFYIGISTKDWMICYREGYGITEVGVKASERLGGDVDGTCFAAGTFAGEGSTCSGGGTRAENLAEVGWCAEVDNKNVLRKL